MLKFLFFLFPFFISPVFAQINLTELGRFGGTGSKAGMFKNPSAIDISENRKVFVCDQGNHRIQAFDLKGNFIKDFGGYGWTDEQFDQPKDIWARSTINMFVADFNNQRVQRFDRHMNYINSFYSNAGEEERFQFREVLSVAYSPQGDIFILDGGENKVIKFNRQNQGETAFGYYESGTGELSDPVQLDLTSDYRVLVSDAEESSIFVFDYFGSYLNKISHPDFQLPNGLAIDDQGKIYLTDSGSKSIFIFYPNFQFLYQIKNIGNIPFKNPMDLALFKNKINDYNLYLIDSDQIVIASLQFNESRE